MMRLSEKEIHSLRVIAELGGSYCPGTDNAARIPRDRHKSLKRMAKDGFLSIDTFDDGPVFSLTAQGRAEVD